MKKCPTCEKTFDDSMRFCQVDGTPLVDDAPAFDPYATIVATSKPVEEPPAEEPFIEAAIIEPEALAVEEPIAAPVEPKVEVEEPVIHQTIGSLPIAPPDEILDLPSDDPLKTMYVSDSEMQAALGRSAEAQEPDVMELPPIEETPMPAPPSFIAPEVPPPSPFAAEPAPMPEPELEPEPAAPAWDEAATIIQSTPVYEDPPSFEPPAPTPFEPAPMAASFEPPPAPVAEWTPPPAPDASWQNQEIGSNTPFQPPPAGVAGQNKTLPIVSLVLGIISLCCYVSPITGLAALITGFMGMRNVNNDPNTYGGKGLAIAGMVTGGIFFLLGVAYWIYIIVVIGFVGLSSLGR